MIRSAWRPLPVVLVLGALLSGCGVETGLAPPVNAPVPTQVLPSVEAPAATEPSPPSQPTPTEPCSNDAQFVEDLTLPDGTQVLPGAALDKRWLILNRGECAWGPEYRLVQIGDSRIEGPRELALYPAVGGSQATWQVPLVAPLQDGEYISRWRAQAPDGTLFGEEVYVLIVVDASPLTPSPIPTAPRS